MSVVEQAAVGLRPFYCFFEFRLYLFQSAYLFPFNVGHLNEYMVLFKKEVQSGGQID